MNKTRKPRKGHGLIEYALIMVLVSTVSIAVLITLGKSVQNTFYTSTELIKIAGGNLDANNDKKDISNSSPVTANNSLACLKTGTCP